jgi:hypothetical protein
MHPLGQTIASSKRRQWFSSWKARIMSDTVVTLLSISPTDNCMLTSRPDHRSQDQNLTQKLSYKGKAVFG